MRRRPARADHRTSREAIAANLSGVWDKRWVVRHLIVEQLRSLANCSISGNHRFLRATHRGSTADHADNQRLHWIIEVSGSGLHYGATTPLPLIDGAMDCSQNDAMR